MRYVIGIAATLAVYFLGVYIGRSVEHKRAENYRDRFEAMQNYNARLQKKLQAHGILPPMGDDD